MVQIQINFAEEKELKKVKGVGEVIAKNIVDYRNRVGNIQKDTISEIKKNIKVTQDLLDSIDFTLNPDLSMELLVMTRY